MWQGLDASEVDEMIYGNVVVKSGAPNIAREVLLDAGLPREIPGTTVVVQCLSGLECVAQAARLIEVGDCEAVIAGGSDSLFGGYAGGAGAGASQVKMGRNSQSS